MDKLTRQQATRRHAGQHPVVHLWTDKLAKLPVIPSALYNLRVALLACPLLIGCLAAGCQSGKGGSDLLTENRITCVNPSSVSTEEGEVIYCDSAEMTSRSSLFLYGTYATVCLAVSGCGLLLWKRRKLRKEIHTKNMMYKRRDLIVRRLNLPATAVNLNEYIEHF